MLLDLLRIVEHCCWFVLTYVIAAAFIIAVYQIVMCTVGYRLIYLLASHYLRHHGQGYSLRQNRWIVGVDLAIRILSVIVFAALTAWGGLSLLPFWSAKFGLLLAEMSFFFLMIWVELNCSMRVGKLIETGKDGNAVHFKSMDLIYGGDDFYSYKTDYNHERLNSQHNYVVVDYPFIQMYRILEE